MMKAKIRRSILKLSKRKLRISYAEYEKLRCNSHEWEAVDKNLDNDALIKVTEHAIQNSSPQEYYPTLCYDETVIHRLAPLLIERLKECDWTEEELRKIK